MEEKTKKTERKNELRKWIAKEKTKHSTSILNQLSTNILTHLEKLPAFRDAQTVLLYHSLKDEVYTHEFIKKWADTKRIVLPVVVGGELELRRYTCLQDLTIGAYNIYEPIGEAFIEYKLIDIAIVPGVAFDTKGDRLGRGKGYYDKLLPHIPALKVGICFPFQVIQEVPSDEFDIRMDFVITASEKQY